MTVTSRDLRRLAEILLAGHRQLRLTGAVLRGPRDGLVLVDQVSLHKLFVLEHQLRLSEPALLELIGALETFGVLSPTTLGDIWGVDLVRATILVDGQPPPLDQALHWSYHGLTALSATSIEAAYQALDLVRDDLDNYRAVVADLGRSSFRLAVEREAEADEDRIYQWAAHHGGSFYLWQIAGVWQWDTRRVLAASLQLVHETRAREIASESKRPSWRRFLLLSDPNHAPSQEARRVYAGGPHVCALVTWLLGKRPRSFSAREALRGSAGVGGVVGLREAVSYLEEMEWLQPLPRLGERNIPEFLDRSWAVIRLAEPDPTPVPSYAAEVEKACLGALTFYSKSVRSPHPTTETVAKRAGYAVPDVRECLRRLALTGRILAFRHSLEPRAKHGRVKADRWSLPHQLDEDIVTSQLQDS